jgi:NADH-quinone oxidoreductase subunit J
MSYVLEVPSMLDKVAFIVLSGALLGFGLLTITRRSAVSALISLIAAICAMAGLFATLSAHFLAVLQVLVYAGAIMVLFIFAVMILNRDEEQPIALRGLFLRTSGVLAAGYFFYRLAWLVVSERKSELLASSITLPIPGYGNAASIGRLLFSDFLFPFEAVSLLLLVAVVAGVLVARPPRPTPSSGEGGPP